MVRLSSLALCGLAALAAAPAVRGDAAALKTCLQKIPRNAKTPDGATQSIFPGDAMYDYTGATVNAMYADAKPAATFYAFTTDEVSQAVKCAASAGVKVSPASGRQGFQRNAVLDGYLTIDLSYMREVSVDKTAMTLTAQSGVTNGMLAGALDESGTFGYFTMGLCTFVSVGGFGHGGGLGPGGRQYGLGCDNLISLEYVLPDGSIVDVDQDNHPDLLWAACGSGGGAFGIATRFTFKLHKPTTDGKLTKFGVRYKAGKSNFIASLKLWQANLNKLDRRFGGTHTMGNDAHFDFSGLFFGTPAEAAAALKASGILDKTLLDASAASNDLIKADFPTGVFFDELPSYAYYAGREMLDTWLVNIPTPWGQAGTDFSGTAEQMAWVESMVKQDGKRIVGGYNQDGEYRWPMSSQARMAGVLSDAALGAIADFLLSVQASCGSPDCLFSVSGHFMGGAYNDKKKTDTAFYHRDKQLVLDGVAVVTGELTDANKAKATAITDKWGALLDQYITDNAKYINYLPDKVQAGDFGTGFFGENYRRLQEIKSNYDPTCMFTKKWAVEGAEACKTSGSWKDVYTLTGEEITTAAPPTTTSTTKATTTKAGTTASSACGVAVGGLALAAGAAAVF